MPGSTLSPRNVALDVLKETLRRGRPFDDVLATHESLAQLNERDRAFVRLLVVTVLRRQGQIDALISACLEHPLPSGTAPVYDALRLGVAQLMFLKTPPHAAVDTSVNLVIDSGHGTLKGLVNAVLRRLSREGEKMLAEQDAARLNTPDWLWASWVAAYGEKTARDIAAALLAEPPTDITIKKDPEEWAAKLKAEILPTGSLRRPPASQGGGGIISSLPGFEEGEWWIQDAAAALPVKLLGDVAEQRVIDLCAAPGGKTAQLAAAGAQVTAIDSMAPRLDLLRQNMKRLKLDAILFTANALHWRPREPAPFVLLDAPCSATGIMRRHPDIGRLKTPKDVARLIELQDKLLDAAGEMVAPNGLLVYCVCSLQPEEGVQRVEAFLARNGNFDREKILASEVGGISEFVTAAGDLRTLPCHMGGVAAAEGGPAGGIDGFYAARLRRRG